MRAFIQIVVVAAGVVLAMPADPASNIPKVASTAETAPRADLFRDPFRKVKPADREMVNADLRPLFAWYKHRRGKRPMEPWRRFIVTTIESGPDGVLVSNQGDNKVFFLQNYPYKVPGNTVIHVFALDSGYHKFKKASGEAETYHAFDYGIPYNPATEKKGAGKKDGAGDGAKTDGR